MYELVNPSHPDKVADRIAGALVDLAYSKQENPKVAVEVLIGHKYCHIINETSCHLSKKEVSKIVKRIVGKKIKLDYLEVPQDINLAKNQDEELRCGDNGIFKGMPITPEQKQLVRYAKAFYENFSSDGKYILDTDAEKLIVCQSNATEKDLNQIIKPWQSKKGKLYDYDIICNPLGYWTGGINVDSGATNRKLGSDLADSITGGGLHGKDLSKADVSITIVCFLLAQKHKAPCKASCAIGDTQVIFKINLETVDLTLSYSYAEIVDIAKDYIKSIGGFEKLAKWGLIGAKN